MLISNSLEASEKIAHTKDGTKQKKFFHVKIFHGMFSPHPSKTA
jgi:hypothetical protein